MIKDKSNHLKLNYLWRRYSLAVGVTSVFMLGAGIASANNVSEPFDNTKVFENHAVNEKISLRGQVYEKTSSPMPMVGVSVQVKGKAIGVTTDIDGYFNIQVEKGDVLVFSFIGFKTTEYTVKRRESNLIISMEEDVNLLNEVVVTGLSEERKLNSISSISQVKVAANVVNKPITSLSQALQGGVTGISVSQESGLPGGDAAAVKIRGVSTLGNSDPLVLVDGIPMDMNNLDPNTIESVTVLKDAAAAAVYGARAANGVIVVKTKRGVVGKVKKDESPKVTLTAMFAQEKPITDFKLMSSTADFMELHNIAKLNANPTANTPDYSWESIEEWREADKNPNGIYTNPVTGQQIPNWLAYPNTDWAQILFQPAFYQKYGVNVSGGSKNTTYLLSLGYQDNPGTLDNTSMERFNIRANVETKIADIITFGTQTYGTKEFKDPGSTSMTYLLQAWPGQTPIYDGKYGASEHPEVTQKDNILQQVAAQGGQNTYTRLNTTWYANIELPLKGLVAEAKFNWSQYSRHDEHYSQNLPRYSFRESFDTPKEGIGVLDQATTYRYAYESTSYTADLLLRYNNTFGKHDVGAFFGYERKLASSKYLPA